jgi:hypothetical protein
MRRPKIIFNPDPRNRGAHRAHRVRVGKNNLPLTIILSPHEEQNFAARIT